MNTQQKQLIKAIRQQCKDDPRILAAWLEGSIARKEDDDWADIDLWIAVKNTYFDEFIEEREDWAAKLGPVLSILYPRDPEHAHAQEEEDTIDSFSVLFDHLPVTMRLDVDVQKRTRRFHFTEGSDAEECMVLFDHADIIKTTRPHPDEEAEELQAVLEDTVVRFWHQMPRVIALLERGDHTEAARVIVDQIEKLVLLYRIIHMPDKALWGYKDIEYDIPEAAMNTIDQLWPALQEKALRKQVKKLARIFHKQSQILAKKMDIDLPLPLVNAIMKEL